MPATPSSAAHEMFAVKGGEKVYAALLKGMRSRIDRGLVFEDPKSTCVHINGSVTRRVRHDGAGEVRVPYVACTPAR